MSTAFTNFAGRSASWSVLGLLAGLYAAQSVTGSMVQTALPVVLRDAGMPLDQIGYLAVLFLPWALKFLWAPLIDRFLSERTWILLCQAGIILCFLAAIALPPQTHMAALAAVLLVMGVFAATQDVATDSLAVRASDAETRGLASGASTAGAYLGFLIGGGLWLVVYQHAGWAVSMGAMAGFVCLLTIPVFLSGNLAGPRVRTASTTQAIGFRKTIRNRALMYGLIFLVVYQVGLRMGSALTGPYLVDKGIALDTIGLLRGAGGAVAGFIASSLGALFVQAAGITRSIVIAAVLNALLLLALATVEFTGTATPMLALGILLAQVAAVAFSFVALYAAMMNWCNPEQTATDFAALQSIDAILAIAASSVAGVLGNAFGYGTLFSASAIFILAAILIAPRTLGASAKAPQNFALPKKVSES
ncbi:MFS transporter [Shinella curvata]|uniref:MFS transporter n=1 Tax=Shinella curvata TaxID=1817964 RepID=A0ABT8XDB0_9HYPH|nr:MFS transporter [Shinella curvata]MCJ8055319.1 MFS transporter [Shinella curvata]MDO6121736.1 MFS transporter [Shinella curvata]